MIFAGHGAVIPDKGIDQLAGADLKGAVVLILYDAPEIAGFPGYSERVEAVAAAGAAAVIGIVGEELPWPVVQRIYDAGQKRLAIHAPAPLAGRDVAGGGRKPDPRRRRRPRRPARRSGARPSSRCR